MFAHVNVRECNDHADIKFKVHVKFNGVPSNTQEIDDYLKKIDEVYQKKEPFMVLYDASNIGLLMPHHVKKQADFMREKDSLTSKYLKRCAIIVFNGVARTLLDGLFVLKPPACPLQVYQDIENAKIYLKKYPN